MTFGGASTQEITRRPRRNHRSSQLQGKREGYGALQS